MALGALVQVLALSCWYSVSAVAPQLAKRWDLTSTGTAWLTSAVLLGFSAGALTLGLVGVADRVRPQLLLPLGSGLAAAATAAPALLPLTYPQTIALRVVTGIALAAVYPPGMRVVTSWTGQRRGTAVSIVVAALAVGSALPHAAHALPIPGWRPVLLAAAAAATVAAGLARHSRLGPDTAPRGPFRPRAVTALFLNPRQRLITIAYLGHMWEIYGMWTWLPAILDMRPSRTSGLTGILLDPNWGTFLLIGAAGTVGCLTAGWTADRWGRTGVATATVAVSTCCCLTTPLLPLLPAPVTAALLTLWGIAVIADSPLYSTLLADTCPPDTVGTALTTQMALGYALAVIPVIALPLLADTIGWQWALLALAPGPLTSTVALTALKRTPHPL